MWPIFLTGLFDLTRGLYFGIRDRAAEIDIRTTEDNRDW